MSILRTRVARLRRHLDYLRADAHFQGVTRFATDFSELYAYVTPDPDDDDSVTLGIIPDAKVYFLALSRLFEGGSSAVHLLPPHVEELALYAGHAQRTAAQGEEYRERARQLLGGMSPTDRERLRKLAGITSPSPSDLTFVTTLVKDRFADFCVDVAKYHLAFGAAHNAMQKLHELVTSNAIDLDLDLDQLPLDEIARQVADGQATVEDVYALLTRPSFHLESSRPLAKLRDARAIVWLREINRFLAPRRERLILVSRDIALESAVAQLATNTEFGWPDVHVHVRGLHTVYLDYLSRAEGPAAVNRWLERVDELLAPFEGWLQRHPQNENIPEAMWQQTARLWDEQANLRLSLLVGTDESEWLKRFISMRSYTPVTSDDKPPHSLSSKEPIHLLKALWNFVDSQEYQAAAEREIDKIWITVQDASLRVLFSEQLPSQDVDAILTALNSEPSPDRAQGQRIAIENQYTVSYWLDFEDRRLRNSFEVLRGALELPVNQRYDVVRKALRKVIDTMTTSHDRAETFLFITLVLAIQERWPEACRVAQRAAALAREASKPTGQFDYFAALTARKYAESSPQQPEVWSKAYEAAERAVAFNPVDPRFLKERGTIGLQYWTSVGTRRLFGETLAVNPLSSAWISGDWQDARRDLEAALALVTDDRLRLDLLNNLAWMSLHDEDGIDAAEEYVRDLAALISSQPSSYPLIFDTMMLVEGARGYLENKPGVIHEAQRKLEPYLDSSDVSMGDRELIRRSISQLAKWRLAFPTH